MSHAFGQFGAFTGKLSDDIRITLRGPGRKNALNIFASYRPPLSGYDANTFRGRILIFQGINQFQENIPIGFGTAITQNKVVFDLDLMTPGPHSFLLPLSQLEGNQQSDEGGDLTIVLCVAVDNVNGPVFVPKLVVSGQTLPYGGGA